MSDTLNCTQYPCKHAAIIRRWRLGLGPQVSSINELFDELGLIPLQEYPNQPPIYDAPSIYDTDDYGDEQNMLAELMRDYPEDIPDEPLDMDLDMDFEKPSKYSVVKGSFNDLIKNMK